VRITDQLADAALQQELGSRVERLRIEAGLTQAELAREAGVSKRTVERMEAGESYELGMLIRVLRVLKLTEGFNTLLPELPPSPMALLKLKGKERRRVVHSRAAPPAKEKASTRRKPWKWEQ
jgi:transcriptional regulator with XRE-family HTH domain